MVYVAMEFVPGISLDVWMQKSHPWRTVLPVFIQAGRGLGAAHHLSAAPGLRRVSLFEAGAHFGGHANTVDVTAARDNYLGFLATVLYDAASRGAHSYAQLAREFLQQQTATAQPEAAAQPGGGA